jgi:hypothetical protein
VITPPRRSVTRFFIPLIDVLILLFCIFLLMPFVSAPASPEDATKDQPKETKAPTDLEKLREERDEAIRRLEQFRKDRTNRLLFRSLEIDPTSGLLIETTGLEKRHLPQSLVRARQEKRPPTPDETRAAAEEMKEWVNLQKRRAAEQEKDAFFLLRLPTTPGGHPTEGDHLNYQAWFPPGEFGYESP